jgi:hypothetical protein
MASNDVQGVTKGGIDPIIKPHISELPFTWANWHKHINWLNTNTVIVLPIIGIIGAIYTPLLQETFFAAVVYYFITGLGITAGTCLPSFSNNSTLLIPAQVTTDYGPIGLMQPVSLFRSGLPLWVEGPLRIQLGDGVEITEHTIALLIQTKTLIPCEKDCSTPT